MFSLGRQVLRDSPTPFSDRITPHSSHTIVAGTNVLTLLHVGGHTQSSVLSRRRPAIVNREDGRMKGGCLSSLRRGIYTPAQ
jgi:hypothetical protein